MPALVNSSVGSLPGTRLRRRHDGVAALVEKIEEGATDIRRAHIERFVGHRGLTSCLRLIRFAVGVGSRVDLRVPIQNSADMIR